MSQVKVAQVLVVSVGCGGGALVGFYLVHQMEEARREAVKNMPPTAVPNLPEHLQGALKGESVSSDRPGGGS